MDSSLKEPVTCQETQAFEEMKATNAKVMSMHVVVINVLVGLKDARPASN